MKKFFITLLILIIAAGVVFFFGWVQIQIPSEGYAVIFTKTHGYEDSVVEPGSFVWRWQRLIPTNLTYHVFKIQPEEMTFSISGDMPSGKIYSDYLKGNPDFSWEIDIFLHFDVAPEMLPSLVKDEKITQETLPRYMDLIKHKTESVIYPIVLEYIQNAKTDNISFNNFTDLEETLHASLADSFPSVNFRDFQIISFTVPDMALYRKGKEYYHQLIDLEFTIRQEEIARATVEDVAKNARINILKEYGMILSDYPVLMDYLELKGSFQELSGPADTMVPIIIEE